MRQLMRVCLSFSVSLGRCYSTANYTCSNHFTLCPIDNAADCSGACYSPAHYACQNGKLQQLTNATQTAK
jgi:hypothetical protein